MGRGGSRIGAGRPAYKVKAEHLKRLDVRQLVKMKALLPGFHTVTWDRDGTVLGSVGVRVRDTHSLRLEYSVDGRDASQYVPVHRSQCHLGGSRPWLGCPCCARRVCILYLRQGRFACRSCQRVAYASQSEDACGRSWRMQQKLERRLDEDWHRPKGMRRTTHERLIDRLSACEEVRDLALVRQIAVCGFGR